MKTITYKELLLIVSLLIVTLHTLKAQTITSISPSKGSLAGNTLITIKGTGFKSKPAVLFGKVGASSITIISDTELTVINAAVASPQSVKVQLIFNGKPYYAPNDFEFKLPEITAIKPNFSSIKGNEQITIEGNYLTGASEVLFDKAGGTDVKVISDTKITVLNPNKGTTGTVNVTVGVQAQTSKVNNNAIFKYKNFIEKYTVSLKNLTGLSNKYKIYVLGFSTDSQKMLTLNGGSSTAKFSPMTSKKGYVQSYELGKDIKAIELSNANPISGARIYFFMAEEAILTKTDNTGYNDNSNKTVNENLGFKYSNSGKNVTLVGNPPQTAFPQYNYIEATFKTNEGLYIDISTVDGFFFPLSLLAQDKNGKELDRIGQPKNLSANQIVNAYKPFMKKLKSGGEPTQYYDPLFYAANGDLTALLNPGLYLESNTSMLETVFDAALNKLYTDASLKMNIWQNGTGEFAQNYEVSPVQNKIFPGTNNTHSALKFTIKGAETLHLFNPVGFSVVSYLDKTTSKRKPIMGTITNNVLTFETPLPLNSGLIKGMYVSDGGGSTDGETQITKINTSKEGIVSVNLNSSDDYPKDFQYKFSKAPANYYLSSGQMTFAGIGLFADGAFRYPGTSDKQVNIQTVVNGLENQISTALNRGVALLKPNNTSTKGRTTKIWAIETNWYPKGEPQNYFSYFMHTAKIGNTNIFTLPKDAVKSARGAFMGRSYGFAYDENPIGGYGGAQVPSEFSADFPKGTTKLELVLGAWK